MLARSLARSLALKLNGKGTDERMHCLLQLCCSTVKVSSCQIAGFWQAASNATHFTNRLHGVGWPLEDSKCPASMAVDTAGISKVVKLSA